MRQRDIEKLITKRNYSVNQFVKNFCGELLGYGLYRDVYELKLDKRFVVKIERDMSQGMFANATEFRNYVNTKEWTFFSDYLAPCNWISETGQIMIQAKIEFRAKKEYPKMIPAMFTDTKIENFGWIGDKFVCCDYSFIPFYIIAPGKKKMKKVKWWSLKDE